MNLFVYGDCGCGGVDGIRKGIEFSIRNNTDDGPWIPLHLNAIALESEETPTSVVIRGYQVSASIIQSAFTEGGSHQSTTISTYLWEFTADK